MSRAIIAVDVRITPAEFFELQRLRRLYDFLTERGLNLESDMPGYDTAIHLTAEEVAVLDDLKESVDDARAMDDPDESPCPWPLNSVIK